MNADPIQTPTETAKEEAPTSRVEIQIEREKVQIERERLALERERLAAERERWKIDAELRPRAEGRGITVGTLVYISIICALVGVIAGSLTLTGGARSSSRLTAPVNIRSLMAGGSTNQSAGASSPVVLRTIDASRGAYLLILD